MSAAHEDGRLPAGLDPHDVVVIAWATLAVDRWQDRHGRMPTTAEIKSGAVDRLMEGEPCWDCGGDRENPADYFCRACRRVRTDAFLETVPDRGRPPRGGAAWMQDAAEPWRPR